MKTEKKSIGAKQLSKGAMIFSSLWIAVLTLLKGFGKINLDIDSIIYSGVAITAVWTPTFISIITDKIKKRVGEK
ncbi:MAG: hypothetical protein IJL70_00520 [Treponema sp.]|nr:hypothetical protein [bacterium]MBQ5997938.1 hypothetical protein [Treponema sp.]MBQ6056331.1 hypothetical protein [Treponema sp.]